MHQKYANCNSFARLKLNLKTEDRFKLKTKLGLNDVLVCVETITFPTIPEKGPFC